MDTFPAAGPGWVLGIAFILGLLVGSFLNVVIHRLPRGESVVHPRSRCPRCGHAIGSLENVPVLSWLVLRGRCRGCGGAISIRYPALELLTGLLFLAVALRYGATPSCLAFFVLAALLVAAAGIDFEHRLVPDEISVGGLVAGLVLVPGAALLEGASPLAAVLPSVAGAVLGFGILWIVGFVHARVSAASGRTFPHWPGDDASYPRAGSLDYWTWFPGMGFGDVKLMAMIGAFLGPAGVIGCLLLASLAGLVLGLGWWLVRRDWDAPFGFGPALSVGALLVALSPWRLTLPF